MDLDGALTSPIGTVGPLGPSLRRPSELFVFVALGDGPRTRPSPMSYSSRTLICPEESTKNL